MAYKNTILTFFCKICKFTGWMFLLFIAVGSSRAEMVSRTQIIMGTFATVTVPKQSSFCIERAFATMKEVEKALSSYDKEADIYRLNRERSGYISPYTYEALLKAERYYDQSDRYFDITVGSITKKLYRFGEKERIPEKKELKHAKTGFHLIDFNRSWAKLSQGIFIDFGGFGKGFGVDKAVEVLKRCGVEQAKVSLSGDIRCIGTCHLGIEDPFSKKPLLIFKTLKKETGISTSGNYRRFVGTKKNNHLIDPKTHMPEENFASVTLIGSIDNSDLDAWATAAAVMPSEKALSFLESLPVAYILIYNDGKVVKSRRLPKYVHILKEPH